MWCNAIMIWLMRSPLQGFLSKSFMVMTLRGRKSSKTYTVPMNYSRLQDGQGEFLFTTSKSGRTWWRNLRGGAPVSVRLQGQERQAIAEAFEDEAIVATDLAAYLQQAPQLAKYYQVGLTADGHPNPEDIRKAAQGRVVVHTRIV